MLRKQEVGQSQFGNKRLLMMLICLTLIYVLTQVFLFFVHYKVTELVDSMVNSSISSAFFQSSILFPFLMFISIQVIAYVLFVTWIWFISVSTGELFKLSDSVIYLSGVSCWMLACAALLGLNQHYYSHSFFSELINEMKWVAPYVHIITVFSVMSLLVVTVLAYINFLLNRTHCVLAILMLLIAFVVSGDALYYKYHVPYVSAQTSTKPNIIIIGLDSLRPDFTGYFKKESAYTPNIDKFLSSATTFTQAYSPLARTFPAWISVLTAKYPKHSGARNNLADPVALLKEETLAKKLNQAGYETIYATDEKRFSNITTGYGFDRVVGPGMGVNDFLLGGLGDFPLTNLLVNLPIGRVLFPYHYGNRAAAITYDPANFLQLVKSGIANRPNKPLFLAVHLCLSHWPFIWAQDHQAADRFFPAKYRHSVEAVDMQLGQLLQMLKVSGLLEYSVVVLLSDHGTTLGLPGDRVINQKNFVGDKSKMKLVSLARYSSAPEYSINFKDDYSLDTSYGQGTDVLSLRQNHVLLAFKGYGINLPVRQINTASSLLDIAPTLLDYLDMTSMNQIDGVSLMPYFSRKNPQIASARALFIETGDSLSEIETDHIYIEKVIKHEIGVYQVNPENGLLFMDKKAEASVLANKQHAVLLGDWMLARYPAQKRMKFVATVVNKKKTIVLETYDVDPYYVLANVRTGQWTVGLSSSFAKTAPLQKLMRQMKAFYGNELA